MRTSKPFATISYNSVNFLTVKLDELVQRGVLDFYVFVPHLKEDDETKDHIHLYCVPSKLFDTFSLIDYLKEFDSSSDKPLTCIACKSSKFSDWYLYCSHNVEYLASKNQSRKYQYGLDEFISSSVDYLNEEIHQIDYSKFSRLVTLKNAVESGLSFTQLVSNGFIPVQLINQYSKVYEILKNDKVERDGRYTHDNIERHTHDD